MLNSKKTTFFACLATYFYVKTGIIKKLKHLEKFQNLSPLANAVFFDLKKKKKIGAELCRWAPRAHARPVTDIQFFFSLIKNFKIKKIPDAIASWYRRRLQNGSAYAREKIFLCLWAPRARARPRAHPLRTRYISVNIC